MHDAITLRCGDISVWQQDGKDGTAHVMGTKFCDRVPMGSGIQWAGIRSEPVDPRPPAERDAKDKLLAYFECANIGHLETHRSLWVRQDNFSPDDRKRNGRMSYCKACEAVRAKRYRQRQSAQAAMTMRRAG